MKTGKTLAYIRVSSDKQTVQNQRLSILEYSRKNNIQVDEFIEVEVSSGKSTKKRKIDELLEKLQKNDFLIVSELSRLARSVGQIIILIDTLIKNNIKFLSLKENIRINGKMDIQTKTMITMFGLFAEIERDLISMRTKEALSLARAKGVKLGRPKGHLSSKLDKDKKDIINLFKMGVRHSVIAKKFNTTDCNFSLWLRKNKLR